MVPTFEEIGTQWECGELEVFQERRACRIVLRIMESLRRFIKPSQANSPLAIGMNPEGDFYEIVGTMVEIVLKDLGWQANFLGNNLPLDSLRAAIERHRPRLVWLSCSHLTDEWRFIEQWNALFDRFGSEISFVVGGRALHGEMRKNLRFTVHCDTVSQLEQAARITAFAS
jgi:methanogenic corrinoid protein MtbC1